MTDTTRQRTLRLTTVLVLTAFLASTLGVLASAPHTAAQSPGAADVLVNPSFEGVHERANGYEMFYDGVALASTARTGSQSVNLADAGTKQAWSALAAVVMVPYENVAFRDVDTLGFHYDIPNVLTTGTLKFQAWLNLDEDGDGVRDHCILHTSGTALAQTSGWVPFSLDRDDLFRNAGPNCSGGPNDTTLAGLQADAGVGGSALMSVTLQTTLAGPNTWPAGEPVYVDDVVLAAEAPLAGPRVILAAGDNDCGGPSGYATIAHALACTSSGATVAVQPGVHEEAIVVDTNRLGNPLRFVTLCAAAPGSTICDGAATTIDATGLGAPAIDLYQDGDRVEGLTIRGDAPLVRATDTFTAKVIDSVLDAPIVQSGTTAVIELTRADFTRIEGNAIGMSVNIPGFGGTAYGIHARDSDGVRIEGNTIVGSQHPAETAIRLAPLGAGTDGGSFSILKHNTIRDTKTGVRLQDAHMTLVSYHDMARVGIGVDLIGSSAPRLSHNTITGAETETVPGFLEFGVFVRQGTTDYDIDDNDITLFPRGVYVGGSAGGGGQITHNRISFNGIQALLLEGTKATPDLEVTGNIMEHNGVEAVFLDTNRVDSFRQNRMVGGQYALVSNPDPNRFPNLEFDARLNGWGVDNYRLIESRINAQDTQNVRYLPYLDIEEPGLPKASSHGATSTSCDAHADAEWVGNHCRFLTVQAALDFADAGATVYVPMSAHLHDPTPYFEALTVTQDGITVCSSPGGLVCASEATKGHFEIRDNMAFGEPPVLWSGEAIALDTSEAPGHGSTSFFPPDGFQIDDIEAMTFDWLIESGTCGGAGSPRVALWSDLDGSGTRESGEQVLVYPDIPGCAAGEWYTEDLLNEPGVDFWHPDTGNTDQAGAHGAMEALDPAYQVDSINVQYDTAGSQVWLDNARVNGYILAEALDLACVVTQNVTCRQDFATSATIIDGSEANTVVAVDADDVTLDGLTLRRTGDQAPGSRVVHLDGVANPAVVGNAIEIEGGGCLPDQLALGGCFDDPQTAGITGRSTGALIEGNGIRADLFSDDTNEIGGTNGLIGPHDGARVANNTFEAWAANAIFGQGAAMEVTGNVFQVYRAGVMGCPGADDMDILGNLFAAGDTALKLCGGLDAPTGVEAHDNNIGLSNTLGMAVDPGINGAFVDAECNDWGVYHDTVIQEVRINDTNMPGNVIDTNPFTSPDVDPSLLRCLGGPIADFTASNFNPVPGERVVFTDLSENATYLRPIVRWEWDFGDGATASGPTLSVTVPGSGTPPREAETYATVKHVYTVPGLYDVTLRVYDSQGVVGMVTKQIDVFSPGPDLEPIPDQVIGEAEDLTVPLYGEDPEGDPLTLSASGLPPGATLTPLGYGNGMIQWTPTLTQSGVYTVYVTLTDVHGDFDTEAFTITVEDTVPTPGFDKLHDVCILAGYPTHTWVEASDPDGDAIGLTASGLPSWGAFHDDGDGTGTFDWSPPVSAAGNNYAITVTATGGGDTSTGTFNLCVKGHPKLELAKETDPFEQASPGETLLVDATVTNTGSTGAPVVFGGESRQDWTVHAPAGFFLPAGASKRVTFEVEVPMDDDRDQVHIWAEAPDYPGEVSDQYFVVETPTQSALNLAAHSTALGVRGEVLVTYLNGVPASGVDVDLRQVAGFEMYGLESSSVSGVTDADGRFAFDFGVDPASRIAGLHAYEVTMSDGTVSIDAGWFGVDPA